MANFVEQATLIVKDKSSDKIRKINRELSALFRTLKNKGEFDVKVNPRLGSAVQLRRDIRTLNLRVKINPYVTQTGVNEFSTALRSRLRSQNFRVRVTPTVGQVRRPPGGLAAGGGTVRLDTGNLSSILRNAWVDLGQTIERAIIDGFARGGSSQDIAATRFGLQNIGDDETTRLGQEAARFSSQFKSFTRGEVEESLSELLPVVRGDNKALRSVTEQIIRLSELQVAFGTKADSALDQAFLFAKAGESAGRFTDEDGNVDLSSIDQYFDLLRKGIIEFGREIDANLVRALTKTLRTSRYGLDERGFLTALLLAEEEGRTAGVGVNQVIKQLSGERIQKRQLAQLREYGLVGSREVVTGTEGGEPVTEIVSTGTVDEDKLRQNFVGWIIDNILPVLDREGFDSSSPTDVARFAGGVTSDRTATAALVAGILRAQEITKSVDRALTNDTSPERIDSVIDSSLLVSLAEVSGQFANVLGEVTRSMESSLIPVLDLVSSGLNNLANFLSGPDGQGSALRTTTVALGGAAAVGAGVAGGRALLARLSPNTQAVSANTIAVNQNTLALNRASATGATGGDLGGGNRRNGRPGIRPNFGTALTSFNLLGLINTAVSDSTEAAARAEANGTDAGIEQLKIGIERGERWNKALEDFFGGLFTSEDPPTKKERLLGVLGRNQERLAEPGRSEASVDSLISQQAVLTEDLIELGASTGEIARVLTESRGIPTEIQTALDGGIESIDLAAARFGPAAGEGILAVAPQMGQAIGEAALQAFNLLSGSVNDAAPVQNPSLDTGLALP